MELDLFLQMKNTWVMHFFKKLIQLMFLPKSELTTTASSHSIMLRITMRQSSQENYSCRFKKNSKEEQTLEPEMPTAKRKGSTVASMLYRLSSFVASVEICIVELLGIQKRGVKAM